MARELKPIDITNTPEVLRLAEEVAKSGVPRVLRRDNQDVAVISPAPPTSRRSRRSKPTSENDPLWSIVGIADRAAFPDTPADVSSNKHQHLAEAYDDKR